MQRSSNAPCNFGTDLPMTRFRTEPARRAARIIIDQAWRSAMKTWMATAAAISLLAGVSVASAENAPAANDKGNATMEQSAAPKVKTSSHKTRTHGEMHMRRGARETTGFGGRTGTVGSGRNDPSIHQSAGDRDARDFPKRH
jgi:hypothetical protein